MKEFPYDNVSPRYVARKIRSQTYCNECKELFGNKGNTMDLDPIHFQYIHGFDRGD